MTIFLKPKCIVSGGSGFVGSHLVDVLLEDDWDVTVIDTRQPIQSVKWLPLDIRQNLGKSLYGYDFVFHLAAVANARKCSENPILCADLNIKGTLNLLDAARLANVKRFVLASSVWVAGIQVGKIIDENSLFDLSKLNTIYGASKLTQENLCVAYKAEYGIPNYTILRYGTLFGERMWNGLVVRAFLEMANSYGVINIMGNGEQTREFLHVKDLCKAHLGVVNEKTENKTYYLTGDFPISINTIAQEVIKFYPAKIRYIPQRRIEPQFSKVNNSKAKHDLSWEIETSFTDGIKKCFEWWNSLTPEERIHDYWC